MLVTESGRPKVDNTICLAKLDFLHSALNVRNRLMSSKLPANIPNFSDFVMGQNRWRSLWLAWRWRVATMHCVPPSFNSVRGGSKLCRRKKEPPRPWQVKSGSCGANPVLMPERENPTPLDRREQSISRRSVRRTGICGIGGQHGYPRT